MKKQLLIFIFGLIVFNSQAQLVFTTDGPGVVNVEYTLDMTFYDPQGDSDIYLYMWVDTDQTIPELSMLYNDEWGETTSMVKISWSAAESKFIGLIDFNSHDFYGEGIIPEATQINNFSLLLRNEAGDHQTGDLDASNYGYTATTTLSQIDARLEKKSYYHNGVLHINGILNDEIKDIKVYNSLGQLIYYSKVKSNQSNLEIDLSSLPKTVALIHVNTNFGKYFTKRIIL